MSSKYQYSAKQFVKETSLFRKGKYIWQTTFPRVLFCYTICKTCLGNAALERKKKYLVINLKEFKALSDQVNE